MQPLEFEGGRAIQDPAPTVQPLHGAAGHRPVLSIVTPAYNEEANLPVLHRRLRAALDREGVPWQWLIIDDHSSDGTFDVASRIAAEDRRVAIYRFSRNFGSHAAIACGLGHADGDCAVMIAADLQDPPELIPDLLGRWRAGGKVVWAVRSMRRGEARTTIAFSRFYYWILRRVIGLQGMPANGADCFLLDRQVIDAIGAFNERNLSLFALVAWTGFEQSELRYEKDARLHGRSGWTIAKKIKLLIDSFTSFSYLPIRWMSVMGVAIALGGFLYALVIIANAGLGNPVEGWSSLMVAVLILGGAQMLTLGVLGEYLWRALDETRGRPRYILEAAPEASPAVDNAVRRSAPAP